MKIKRFSAIITYGKSILQRNRVSISRAFNNILIVASGQAVSRLAAIAIASLLAHIGSAEIFGQYTLFTVLFLLISEVSNTLDITFIRFANAPDRKESRESCLTTNLAAKAVYAIIAGAAGLLFAPILAEIVFHKPDSLTTIRLAIMSGAIFGLFNVLISSFQQQHRFVWVSLLRPVFNLSVVLVLGIVFLLEIVITNETMPYIYMGCATLLAFICVITYHSLIRKNSKGLGKKLLKFYRLGGVFILSGIIHCIANRLDVYILASFLAFGELAEYGVGIRISALASFLTGTITTILVPKATAALMSRVLFKRYLILVMLYATLQTACGIIAIIWLKPIISLLFGVQYVSASTVSTMLIIQVLVSSYGTPFQAMVQVGRTPSFILFVSAVKIVVGTIILLVLVSQFNMIGAAVGVIIISAMNSILFAVGAFRYSRPLELVESTARA